MSLVDGNEIAPGILVYDDVINNCQDIIDFARSQPWGWRDSTVSRESVVDKEIRDTNSFSLDSYYAADPIWFELARTIWKYADAYGTNHEAAFSAIEPIQMLHYPAGKGFYKPHIDSGPGMLRIFSAVLYLNDIEEGGETYFNHFDVAVKPKAGRLALFPANYMYMHEARPSTNTDKYVIVTWFTPVY
jgi:prolyl 4-hydroxylase